MFVMQVQKTIIYQIVYVYTVLLLHKKYSGLNASEIKDIERKRTRKLKFLCDDCSSRLLMVLKMLKAIDLTAELSLVKSKLESTSTVTSEEGIHDKINYLVSICPNQGMIWRL